MLRVLLVLAAVLAVPAARAQWEPLPIPRSFVFGGQTVTTEVDAYSFGTLGGRLVVTANVGRPDDTRFSLGLATRDEATGRWVETVGPRYATPQLPAAAFDATYLDGPIRTSQGVFVGSDGEGFYRTADEGATYTRLTQGLPLTYPDRGTGASNTSRLWLRGEAGGALWISGYDGLYRSTDGGASWATVTDGLPPFKNRRSASFDVYDDAIVHTVEEQGGALFAAIARGVGSTKTRGGLFRSADGGTGWARVSGGLPDSADVYTFFRAGNRILASTNLNTAATATGYSFVLYASTDGGATWVPEAFPLTTGIGGCPLRFERIGTAIVAACTAHLNGPRPASGGIWTSLDEGATWTDVAANLPRASRGGGVTVGDVVAFGPDLYVVQNTDGADGPSVWRRSLASLGLTATASAPLPDAEALALVAAPNPARGRVRLAVTLREASAVRLSVVDALGREVAVVVDGGLSAGAHSLPLDTSPLVPGLYVVRLATPTGVASARLTVAH